MVIGFEKKMFHFLRKYAPEDVRFTLKKIDTFYKVRLKSVNRLIQGTFSSEDIFKHLKSHTNEDFQILMVHSSFDEIAQSYKGSVIELLKVLLELCGDKKTLVMPGFCFQLPKKYDATKDRELDTFDVKHSATKMGLLPEMFRRFPGVKRSLHPVMSVCALGPLAETITKEHFTTGTAYGYNTPFDIMRLHKTIILGLGVRYFRSLTQVHTAESMLKDEYPLKMQKAIAEIKVIDEHKGIHYYNHSYYTDSRANNRAHDVILPYMKATEFKEWKFHGVPMYKTYAASVTRAVISAAKDGKTIYDHP